MKASRAAGAGDGDAVSQSSSEEAAAKPRPDEAAVDDALPKTKAEEEVEVAQQQFKDQFRDGEFEFFSGSPGNLANCLL